jgi:hypothetical protein
MPPPDTVLVIAGIGLAPAAVRGVTQTFQPIDAAKNLERTVNGKLVNLSPDQFKKYATTFACTDNDTPQLDGIFPGDVVVVDWIHELSLPVGNTPNREIVEGSERVEDDRRYYRPRMTMVVADFSVSEPEWDGSISWQLDLEEE